MNTGSRLNPYVEIHKGVRQALFQTAMLWGRTDWTDEEALPHVTEAWGELTTLLRGHAENERVFVHPIYEERMPGVAQALNADHEAQEAVLAELSGYLDRMLTAPADEARVARGLELYRSFSRFLADYLLHLLREESVHMRNLWDLSTEEEVCEMLAAILRAESPELGALTGRLILQAANTQDLRNFMSAIAGRVPAELIAGMQALAAQVLSARELEKLAGAG